MVIYRSQLAASGTQVQNYVYQQNSYAYIVWNAKYDKNKAVAVTEMNRVLKNEMRSSKRFPERSHNRSKERSAERFPERLHNRSRERSLVIYGGSDLVCACVYTAHSSCM